MALALLILAALAAGVVLPLQVGVNHTLKLHAGRAEWAAMASFAVGAASLAIYNLVARVPWPAAAAFAGAPWWSWIGGVIGAYYVTATILVTPRLGFSTTMALIVGGQMVAALALDRLGAFGAEVRPVTLLRVVGAALIVSGVALIRRY